MPMSRRANWSGLFLLLLLSLVVVLVPVFLIRPFAPQTPGSLALAFLLRRWSPLLTLGAAAAATYLVWRLWRSTPRVLSRAAALLVLLVVLGSAWLARQNHFECLFAPL